MPDFTSHTLPVVPVVVVQLEKSFSDFVTVVVAAAAAGGAVDRPSMQMNEGKKTSLLCTNLNWIVYICITKRKQKKPIKNIIIEESDV